MSRPFIIKETGKYGKGVFAARDIAKQSVIHVLSGETVSARNLVMRVNSGEENIDDPLQVGKRTYIDLDKTSRYFHHSCAPNAAVRKRSELIALKNISKGEEITFDYSLTVAPTEWQMHCACGAKNCRKILGDVLSVPKRIRERFRRLGALQDYMKKSLDDTGRISGYRIPPYERMLLKSLGRKSNPI